MKSLDFMIIGAQKSGTTALSHFLSQHPDVCIAAGKEVHLFDAADFSDDWSVADINTRYDIHFQGKSELLLWGEATPIYLYWTQIIPALKRYNPALKLIVILRDPAERAISHYEMEKSRGNETLPLWLALLRESTRLALDGACLGHEHRCHSYIARGRYAGQLAKVREYFSDEQILVLESDALKFQHALSMGKVCDFLGIDQAPSIKAERVFSGDYQKKHLSPYYAFIKRCLAWRFRAPNKELKRLLSDMGVSADWRWLK